MLEPVSEEKRANKRARFLNKGYCLTNPPTPPLPQSHSRNTDPKCWRSCLEILQLWLGQRLSDATSIKCRNNPRKHSLQPLQNCLQMLQIVFKIKAPIHNKVLLTQEICRDWVVRPYSTELSEGSEQNLRQSQRERTLDDDWIRKRRK